MSAKLKSFFNQARNQYLVGCTILFLFALVSLRQQCLAEDTRSNAEKADLMGEINIEQSDKQASPYAITQTKTIKYFRDAADVAIKLTQGDSTPLQNLDDGIISHLTAAYLYCSSNYGTCSLLLDGILEIDIVNSRLSGTATCPNMSRFWKIWVKNDMESRDKYLVKTGYLRARSDFIQSKRPAYIKCQITVADQLKSKAPQAEFFKTRYKDGEPKALIFAKVARLLEEFKKKVPNLFIATGAGK